MSGQKYKRTNFEEDDSASVGGTPPGVTYDPNVAFKVGATFWQRRTFLEKFLICFSSVLALVVMILAIVIGTHQDTVHSQTTPKVTGTEMCTTLPCVTISSTLLNSLDYTADPCQDFYQYACGGWIKAHPIPSGQSRWGTLSVMEKDNQIIIKNELESKDSKSQAEQKAKVYYTSCMDPNKTVDSLGIEPLENILEQLGGYTDQILTFQELVERTHRLGMMSLFYIGVKEDEKDIEHNILQVNEGDLALAREQYNKTIEEDKVLSAYLKFMTDINVLLDKPHNESRDNMLEVIKFEQQLSSITTPMQERRDDEKMYHKMTIAELQILAPFLDWKKYLNEQLNVTSYRVESTEKIIVYAVEYLTKLTHLLTETNKTPQGQLMLQNYMMMHVVKSLCTYLSKPFQDARKDFLKVITGVSGEEELWRYCTADTNSVMGFAVGAMFVRKTFHGDSKTKAEEMIKGIKVAFKENLPTLSWIDKQTRIAAIAKVDSVVDMIGFPSYILNATALNDRYKDLDLKENEYFENNIRSLKHTIKRNLDKLRKAPDDKSWSMPPATVNAYYTPTQNEIVFPAGILQAPFFDQNFPKSLNYGGMGVVMGHELTHGFDDEGRKYDKDGVLQPWWSNASVIRFEKRAQCMKDMYFTFKINNETVNGNQTVGENIADNGGLKASYHAYVKWVERNGEEPPLPGVKLTHKQLFFLAFSQVWCSNSKPEADHMSILTDPHSPSKYRVIGPLSNSRDFAEQFKCPVGSPMNPKKKCEVW